MSINGRVPKSINMNKLKRGINKRIKGILGYLQNNSLDFMNGSLIQMKEFNCQIGDQRKDAINEEHFNDMTQFSQILSKESQNIENEQKKQFNSVFSLNPLIHEEQLIRNMTTKQEQKLMRTPTSHGQHENEENSSYGNNESTFENNQKDQEDQEDLQIFHAYLESKGKEIQQQTESFNFSTQEEYLIKIAQLKECNKIKFQNNKQLYHRKQRGNKQNNYLTPFSSKSRGSQRSEHSNCFSGVKQISEYFSGPERVTKIVPQHVIEQTREEIGNASKKHRVQANDSNARNHLLRRILNLKNNKVDQLMMAK